MAGTRLARPRALDDHELDQVAGGLSWNHTPSFYAEQADEMRAYFASGDVDWDEVRKIADQTWGELMDAQFAAYAVSQLSPSALPQDFGEFRDHTREHQSLYEWLTSYSIIEVLPSHYVEASPGRVGIVGVIGDAKGAIYQQIRELEQGLKIYHDALKEGLEQAGR